MGGKKKKNGIPNHRQTGRSRMGVQVCPPITAPRLRSNINGSSVEGKRKRVEGEHS